MNLNPTKTAHLAVAVFALSVPALAAPPKNLADALAKGDLAKLQDDLQTDLARAYRKDGPKAFATPQKRTELAVCRLLQIIGVKGVDAVRQNPDGAKFLGWLTLHTSALEDYLASGSSYSYSDYGFNVWSQIWAQCPDSHEGLGLRVATACSLLFFRSWNDMTYYKPLDPVKRFQFFMNSRTAGRLWPYFEKEKTFELTYVVGAWAPDSELAWIRDHLPANLKKQENVGDACWMIPYRDHNDKGSAWDRNAFYSGPATMDAMIKKGGVCIQIAEFTSSTAQAFGIPAIQVGQPSHNATAWRNKDGSWRLAYNIVDWPDTNQEFTPLQFGRRAVLLWAADAAQADTDAYLASERLRWAAADLGDKKLDAYLAALEACPLNYPVAQDAVAEAVSKLKGEKLLDCLLKIAAPLKDYPYPLLDLVQDKIVDLPANLATKCKAVDVVEALLQALAEGNPDRQFGAAARARADLVANVVKHIANSNADLASPLFNGNNADKTWTDLDPGARMTYMRAIEMLIRSGLKRKDLYEQPLKIYAAYSAKDAAAARRAVPVLELMAKQAASAGQMGFATDVARKLVDICEKVGDKSAADEWRKFAG